MIAGAPCPDLAALQGAWKQVGFEANGAVDVPDEFGAHDNITTFAGNHFVVRSPEGVLLLEGEFDLYPYSNPKSVNWRDTMGSDTGKTLPSIYCLEDDHFVFVAADDGAPRPTMFRTVSGQTMRTFVRLP
ncbi:MAG: hypothetical protein RJB62_784 [Pseudomonadota bacterium]|jgi:uncharacterized protein (TIGR03067 family)